jgi:hypothetical protein
MVLDTRNSQGILNILLIRLYLDWITTKNRNPGVSIKTKKFAGLGSIDMSIRTLKNFFE